MVIGGVLNDLSHFELVKAAVNNAIPKVKRKAKIACMEKRCWKF